MNAANFRTNGGANLTDSMNGVTYFFTVPASHNCSGDVISIQYCYRARNSNRNSVITVFNLLAVNRNGLKFRIINSTTIQTTPQDSICREQICCDTTPLSGFQIPSSEYTFGIMITNVRLLAFADSVMEYHFDRFRTGNGELAVGTTVTFTGEDLITDRALLLIRVIIGMLLYYILLHNISVLINYRTYSTNNYQTSDHY